MWFAGFDKAAKQDISILTYAETDARSTLKFYEHFIMPRRAAAKAMGRRA